MGVASVKRSHSKRVEAKSAELGEIKVLEDDRGENPSSAGERMYLFWPAPWRSATFRVAVLNRDKHLGNKAGIACSWPSIGGPGAGDAQRFNNLEAVPLPTTCQRSPSGVLLVAETRAFLNALPRKLSEWPIKPNIKTNPWGSEPLQRENRVLEPTWLRTIHRCRRHRTMAPTDQGHGLAFETMVSEVFSLPEQRRHAGPISRLLERFRPRLLHSNSGNLRSGPSFSMPIHAGIGGHLISIWRTRGRFWRWQPPTQPAGLKIGLEPIPGRNSGGCTFILTTPSGICGQRIATGIVDVISGDREGFDSTALGFRQAGDHLAFARQSGKLPCSGGKSEQPKGMSGR